MRPLDDEAVRAWMERAEADRVAAETLASSGKPVLRGVACFHCQQEAEKLMKATLARLDRDPPRTHDLVHLLGLLEQHLPQLASLREPAENLAPHAVLPRYPSPMGMPSEGEVLKALDHARDVRETLLALT